MSLANSSFVLLAYAFEEQKAGLELFPKQCGTYSIRRNEGIRSRDTIYYNHNNHANAGKLLEDRVRET